MTRPLKIGVSCYASAGGSGIVATELGLALAERGHEVHFITASVPFRVHLGQERVSVHTVETLDYPLFEHPPYTLALAVKMHQVASFHGLDLLHVHYAIPHAASAILASQMGSRRIPVVTTLHGTDITLVGNHPSYHRITRWSIEQSDRVTAVSDFLASETRRIFRTDKKIHTIPNFVDTARFSPRSADGLRARFAKNGERILLHASNFRPVKRALTLVDILAAMEERERTVLLLAGDGPELAALEYKARELGLGRQVKIVGAWERIEELLPVADVYLQPSEHESFGLAALEAMSCGVPVVVTSRGGPSEFIRDGENGFLLDPSDLGAWAARCDALLRDESLRRRVGLAGRASVEEGFPLPRVIDRYEELFQNLMASKVD
ncbi:MAG: N-acetyl-alpha-D-glucosaminyl L-malate synthase BshA [Candidatus Krumholzibacteriia bacterium]|nr:N-acetyl-alpha-D-glucosaminyl L-malate synthase BshA [Candidatus Latescibacterota bacterium]